MLRRLTLALIVLLVSGQAFATNTLPAVQVTGMRINSTVLCSGAECAGLFEAPAMAEWQGQFDEISDLGPTTNEPAPECSGQVSEREGAVWAAYQAALMLRYGNTAIGRIRAANADRENWNSTMTITFSNGSVATYFRTDSMLGGSHGFDEETAPDCDE